MRVVLPYSDPRRRRKVRSLSQALVKCLLWPGEQASSTDIAQLALVRLLWLQREAHRSVHAGLSESAALLTRTAIETCIVGLYCLVTTDAPALLSNQNAHQLRAMLRYLPECVFTQRAQSRVVDVAGTPTTKPSILDMVEAVDKASSGGEAEMLYRAYYAPLSALYAHGGGTALLRHVDHADRVSFRPTTPWFYRSALHITDSCVALLASKIAGAVGADSAVFDRYYEAHRSRTITPVAAIGGKTLPHMIRWRGRRCTGRPAVEGLPIVGAGGRRHSSGSRSDDSRVCVRVLHGRSCRRGRGWCIRR